MASFTGVIVLMVIWVVGTQMVGLYKSFHAPRCPKAESGKAQSKIPCYRPLFAVNDTIDLMVFLTTKPDLKWWTEKGLRELQALPLWNATQVPFGAPLSDARAVIGLSSEALSGVRKNVSTLHAHAFLLRSGSKLEAAIAEGRGKPAGSQLGDLLGGHGLHTSAALTRLLPQVRQKRRNLLANSTEDEAGNTTDAHKPQTVQLSLLGQNLTIHPGEGLKWALAFFVSSAFFEPSATLAAVRHCVAAFLVPTFTQLYMKQQAAGRQLALAEALKLRAEAAPPVPHIAPKLNFVLAVDTEEYDGRYYSPLLFKEIFFQKGDPMPLEREVRYQYVESGKGASYAPPFAIDHFGLRQRDWLPLDSNPGREDPVILVEVNNVGMLWYSVTQTLKSSLNMYIHMGVSERDLHDIGEMLFRYPVHILIIMQVISFLHITLSGLAFKNDIAFFRGRSDYTGLSSRSLATDTLQEIVIFLYLYDFDDISRILLFQFGVSAGISAWKYTRVARLGLYWCYFLPWISYNRGKSGQGKEDDEHGTEEIDARGMRYLKLILYPLSLCWGVHNLYTYSYKSWWSWLISSMADFAYTFGFINMMPQVFINYKLKSVAHMPWRVLAYKFFSTFIDDVFAWFILPSEYTSQKHRLMTLRDDIVFFVFLAQRQIYKVDYSRPDEFGFVYHEEGAKPPLEAPQEPKAEEDSAKDKPVEAADAAKEAELKSHGEAEEEELEAEEEKEGEGQETAEGPAAKKEAGSKDAGLRQRKPADPTPKEPEAGQKQSRTQGRE